MCRCCNWAPDFRCFSNSVGLDHTSCCSLLHFLFLFLGGVRATSLPPYAYNLALVCVLLNSLSSPFLYAYRSRRIQREVRFSFVFLNLVPVCGAAGGAG